ncbi:MAG: N-acetylmuramoyl-L-alanine amidase-like domain-containing protein [Anaeromyxobacteraceae bacterium]
MHAPVLLALAIAASNAVPAPSAERVAEVRAALDAGLSLHPAGAARATWAAGRLRGMPYGESPLGEGEGKDPDPRFRLDRFDCTSLVETALALGAARSVAEAEPLLDGIRYAGAPGYENRNHYVEAQWLPDLAAKGWIADVTAAVGGGDAVVVTVRHRRAEWAEEARRGKLVAGLDPGRMPDGESRLSLVPLARVTELASRIPSGTILLVARGERKGRPYRVVHMGIVVVDGRGERLVRHASRDLDRVVDERLERFVARYEKQRTWPVEGFSFWEILGGPGPDPLPRGTREAPGPRRARRRRRSPGGSSGWRRSSLAGNPPGRACPGGDEPSRAWNLPLDHESRRGVLPRPGPVTSPRAAVRAGTRRDGRRGTPRSSPPSGPG